jgi:hypothetical protein
MPPATSEPFTADDYEAIAAAISETARGRWFLDEFARRSRAAETLRALQAIRLLESSLAKRSNDRGPLPGGAERIGERLLNFVWRLRESGFDTALCDALDRDAQAILEIASEWDGGDRSGDRQPGGAPVRTNPEKWEAPSVLW